MTKEQKLLRECIRQILSEKYERPDTKEKLKGLEFTLKSDIRLGKAQATFDNYDKEKGLAKDKRPGTDQYEGQGGDAQQIFDLIDKNKNETFDEDELPSADEWQKIKDLMAMLYGPRLAKGRK
jgi:hypothetical protein